MFRTYRGLTNLSSISKIYNFFDSYYFTNGLLINKLFSENLITETCLDTLFIQDYGTSGYLTYYWLRKIRSSRRGPIRRISIFVMNGSKSLFQLMIIYNYLKNNNMDQELLIDLIGPYHISLSLKLSNDDLNIQETGLPIKMANTLLESLPGDSGSILQMVTHLDYFFMKDYSWLEKHQVSNGLVIRQVWVDSYIPNYTQLLGNMKERGIVIHKIILHHDYLHKVTETEQEELLSITSNIEICKLASFLPDPPVDRWPLSSVIQ